jgi:DNA-binding beta-propeller fold protein YncE
MKRLGGVFASFALVACGGDVVLPPGLAWQSPQRPDYVSQARLASTDNGDDTLAFVTPDSLDAPRVLGFAPVGNNPIELEGPHHLAASPDGRFIYYNLSNYVTNGGSGPHGSHGTGTVPGYMVKLDAATNRPVGQVLIDRSPGDILVSPDGKVVFVSHYDLARLMDQLTRGAPAAEGYSTVVAIDADALQIISATPVCPTTHGMGLSPDGTELYVTCSLSDQLGILDIHDVAHPMVKPLVEVGPMYGPPGQPTYAPYALTVQKNGLVWISDNQSGDVRVYDPIHHVMDPSKTVHVGGVAMFSAFSPDESKLYVPHQGDDQVTEIALPALTTRNLALPKAACQNAHVLRVLAGGQGAAVVCEGDHQTIKGTMVFLDLAAWAVKGYVQLGLFPDGIIYLPGLPPSS